MYWISLDSRFCLFLHSYKGEGAGWEMTLVFEIDNRSEMCDTDARSSTGIVGASTFVVAMRLSKALPLRLTDWLLVFGTWLTLGNLD